MLQRARTEQATPERLAMSRALWRSFGQADNDLRPIAANIRAPTLLLFGEKDPAIPAKKDGKVAAGCIPHAQFATLPCGHASFAEVPDLFLQKVQPFLAQCSR
jgi:pimeloyl-ACP methyl ester carboxylesterase